jgi:hypothetical protein
MDRRTVLGGLVAVGASTVAASESRAAIVCSPQVPVAWAPNPWTPPLMVQGCQVGLPRQIVGIPAPQMSSEWCWAASISMIFAFHGHAVSQQEIVQQTWGGIANLPGTPAQIIQDLNRNWIDRNGNRLFASIGDPLTANIITAANDLANNNPLIICTSHHAMVLTAMQYRRFNTGAFDSLIAGVVDPWPYQGPFATLRDLTLADWQDVQFMARVRTS